MRSSPFDLYGHFAKNLRLAEELVRLVAALWTLAAVAAYGVFHSLLASLGAKRLARRAFGPRADRVYRLLFNAIGGLTLLPVLAVPALRPGAVLYRLVMPWSGMALAGQALSVAALAVGLLQTDAWHFLGLRQLSEQKGATPPTLVTTGLYRWVRHPLYTAGLALIWLTPVMTTSLLAFNLALTAYILVGSALEERRLLAEFGSAYADYRRRVPRLIPIPRPPWRRAS